ncbi:MarR family winged helix-turn-helix transcriptional regulator [Streptomyces albipurpureus]|uniref:MarR family winged helix-turn-helix transcriptional regulator n=1 Tax=Streptomyces albipurpureus TaxID=2897419 RepID=A0ABT0UMT6_9ACTN|nr:MarR family winged helix-turn-helix transcriptional regulator [Streptomyces sp. CWNU-1]MCM2389938.1 MarR family winged helix-turn-helix transcriptional regulator [Streptomyces sp. CWNU-1]
MSDPAVERARKIIQARLAAPGPTARPGPSSRNPASGSRPDLASEDHAEQPRVAGNHRFGPGATAESSPRSDGEFIGALSSLFSRLRRFDDWLRSEYALNLTELHVLSCLPTASPPRHGEQRASTTARLAEEVELTPGGLTRLADRLIERGLAVRVSDPWDKRVKHLALTSVGVALRDEILPRAGERIRNTCDTQRDLLEQLRSTADRTMAQRTDATIPTGLEPTARGLPRSAT